MQQTPKMPTLREVLDDVALLQVGNPLVADSAEYRTATDALGANGNPPIGSRPATLARVKEQPEHRVMCYMALSGQTNREIAEQLKMSDTTVSNILRQPWARQFMADEAKKIAGDAVEGFLKAEVINSARILVEVRDNPATPPRTRADICNSIIDRVQGKAIQRVITETTISTKDAAEEAAKIDAELAALKDQVYGRNSGGN